MKRHGAWATIRDDRRGMARRLEPNRIKKGEVVTTAAWRFVRLKGNPTVGKFWAAVRLVLERMGTQPAPSAAILASICIRNGRRDCWPIGLDEYGIVCVLRPWLMADPITIYSRQLRRQKSRKNEAERQATVDEANKKHWPRIIAAESEVREINHAVNRLNKEMKNVNRQHKQDNQANPIRSRNRA